MRIAHLADLHICDKKTPGHSTLEERIETLTRVGDELGNNQIDLIVCAGDIYDGQTTPRIRKLTHELFNDLQSVAPVLICKGNHDHEFELDPLEGMKTQIFTRPFCSFGNDYRARGYYRVAALPWPEKKHLANWVDSKDELNVSAKVAIDAILNGFKAEFAKKDYPSILISHCELGDAQMDNDQPVARYADIVLTADDLIETGADYIALGHLHTHQVIKDRVCYSGSPYPTAFLSRQRDYGFCIVDAKKGKLPEIEFVKTDYREMVVVNTHLVDGRLVADSVSDCDWSGPVLSGKSVKIKYSFDANQRDEARLAAEKLKSELLSQGHGDCVILEPHPSNTTREVRSVEVSSAANNSDRLKAWADVNEVDATESLMDKLVEVE